MTYAFFITLYLLFSTALFRIALKTSTRRPWLAFIPIGREWLVVAAARKRWWWFLLLFVPIVNIVVSFIVWARIARHTGRSAWWGRMMIIPFVNAVVICVLAFNLHPTRLVRRAGERLLRRRSKTPPTAETPEDASGHTQDASAEAPTTPPGNAPL